VPIVWALVPVIGRQIILLQLQTISSINYLQTIAPGTTVWLAGYEMDLYNMVGQLTSGLSSIVTSIVPESLTFVFGAARTTVLVVFTFVMGFYLTRDAEAITGWLKGLIPPGYRGDVELLLKEIDAIWMGFFRGQIILVSVVAVILTVLSYLLGLPHPLALGIFGGLLEFLPSIGNMIWGATAIISALVGGSTIVPMPTLLYLLIVVAAYVTFAQVEINILLPYIIGPRVRLHPLVVLIGVIVGASIGGVLGVLLAAPTIASLRIVGRYFYAKLFDLEPFPLVGPLSLPSDQRLEEVERLAAQTGSPQQITEAIARTARRAKPRRRRAKTTEELSSQSSGEFGARNPDTEDTQ
jgi:predicted PurR-regulated permease PerM